MPGVQVKITRNAKGQENMSHNKEKKINRNRPRNDKR